MPQLELYQYNNSFILKTNNRYNGDSFKLSHSNHNEKSILLESEERIKQLMSGVINIVTYYVH